MRYVVCQPPLGMGMAPPGAIVRARGLRWKCKSDGVFGEGRY